MLWGAFSVHKGHWPNWYEYQLDSHRFFVIVCPKCDDGEKTARTSGYL